MNPNSKIPALERPQPGFRAVQPFDPIMRLPEVEATTGLKKSTLYSLMAAKPAPLFPASVRLSARLVGWRTSDVRAWLDARATTTSATPSSTTPAGTGNAP